MTIVVKLFYTTKDGFYEKRIDFINSPIALNEIHRKISDEFHLTDFKLQIKDSVTGFVDLDDFYVRSYKPFGTHQQEENSEPRPTTSIILLELKAVSRFGEVIISTTNNGRSIISDFHEQNSVINQSEDEQKNSSSPPEDEQQTSSSQLDFDSICAPRFIKLNTTNPAIQFTKNLNITLRDDYENHTIRTNSSDQKSSVVRVQGDKSNLKGHEKKQTILPKIKILKRIISNTSKPNFICFLVQEVCQNGSRTLYHHPTHEFDRNDDNTVKSTNKSHFDCMIKKNAFNKTSIVIPFNDKMLDKEGDKIELQVKAVLHAKTSPDKIPHLFCHLENQYRKDTNYTTTRLIIVPQCDENILWEELVLSSATIFCKSDKNIVSMSVRDDSEENIERIPVLRKTPTNQEEKTTSKWSSPEPKKFKEATDDILEVTPIVLPVPSINDRNRIHPYAPTIDCTHELQEIQDIVSDIIDNMPREHTSLSISNSHATTASTFQNNTHSPYDSITDTSVRSNLSNVMNEDSVSSQDSLDRLLNQFDENDLSGNFQLDSTELDQFL